MSWAMLLAVLGALLVGLFLRLRGYAYPSDALRRLPPAPVAVAEARAAVARLCGLDVRGWRAHPAVSVDDEVSELLHQLRAAERHRPLLEAWGLRGSWRVRFVRGEATVRVGLSCDAEVVLLDLNREAERLVPAGDGPPPDDKTLRQRLGGRLWRAPELVGRGERVRDDGRVDPTWQLRLRAPDVRLDAAVHTTGSAVTLIQTAVTPVSDRARAVQRAGATESLASLGGMLGSLLALVLGIGILARLGGSAEDARTGAFALAAVLAAAVVGAVLLTEPKDLDYVAVDAFDGSTSWRVFRVTALLTALCTGIVMAGVVAVATLAGTLVAGDLGLPLLAEPVRQVGWGALLAAAWLGLAAAGWALLRRTGVAAHAAAPDPRLLRQDRVAGLRAVSVAVQSSIGEEATYRLLALPVIGWLTGSWIAAVIGSAVLWAAMHSGSAVRPRWVRFAELTVVGGGLGAAMVTHGFLAPLAAHALFNVVTLLAPLPHRARRGPAPGEAARDWKPARNPAPARDCGRTRDPAPAVERDGRVLAPARRVPAQPHDSQPPGRASRSAEGMSADEAVSAEPER